MGSDDTEADAAQNDGSEDADNSHYSVHQLNPKNEARESMGSDDTEADAAQKEGDKPNVSFAQHLETLAVQWSGQSAEAIQAWQFLDNFLQECESAAIQAEQWSSEDQANSIVQQTHAKIKENTPSEYGHDGVVF